MGMKYDDIGNLISSSHFLFEHQCGFQRPFSQKSHQLSSARFGFLQFAIPNFDWIKWTWTSLAQKMACEWTYSRQE